MKTDKTINYYNMNAKEFVSGTLSVDFELTQKKFISKLLRRAAILDFGCGSGRDTKYFISQGYQLKMSMIKAKGIDIIVSFLMESGIRMIWWKV